MTRAELILEIKSELTVSSALPYSINDSEINRIINQTIRWFNKYYNGAAQFRYYVIPAAEFSNSDFSNAASMKVGSTDVANLGSRVIQMPECVIGVSEVKEMGGIFPTSLMTGAVGYTMSLRSPESVTSIAARQSFYDLTKAFSIQIISYEFNNAARKISIKGRTPKRDVVISTHVSIPENDLFEDYNFIRFCTAQAKISLGRVLGMFDYKLAGGITINGGDLKAEGEQEIADLKEQINLEQPGNTLLMYNG